MTYCAADRDNKAVTRYYDELYRVPFQAMLGLIMREAAATGRSQDVLLWGEIASSEPLIPVLLQLGYHTLSIAPVNAKAARRAVRATDLREPLEE